MLLVFDLGIEPGMACRLEEILAPSFAVTPVRPAGNGAEAAAAVAAALERPRAGAAVALVAAPSCRQPGLGELLEWLRRRWPALPAVLATPTDDADEVLALLAAGVADFVALPPRPVDLVPRLRRLAGDLSPGAGDDSAEVARRLKARLGLRQLVGESPAFVAVIEKIPLLARCDATVLIDGETGTGKEVCARAIHYLSDRSSKPFVPVNCGAIPVELLENEFFGHRRAAYTGAAGDQEGLIASAEGGTLLLDEIDCLSAAAQVKLLRFLQDKEYRQLGSTRARSADVRLIAATNADLGRLVEEGRFRADLYYRLNVLPLTLPPLRRRREDVPLLARHLLARYASEHRSACPALSPGALSRLVLYPWPGNVRELGHAMERAVLLCAESGQVRAEDLPLSEPEARRPPTFQQAKRRVVARFERSYIEDLLLAHRGNISQAARAAAKNRRAFFELIRKHSIDVGRFRGAPGPPPQHGA